MQLKNGRMISKGEDKELREKKKENEEKRPVNKEEKKRERKKSRMIS